MRKKGLILLLIMIATTVKAGDYDYLIIEKNGGEATAFVSDGLTLTYSSSTLTVQPTSGSATTFDLTTLSKMYFSSTGSATGIEALDAMTGQSSVEAFDMGGRSCGSFPSVSDAVKQLPKGIYLMKGQKKTVKVIVQ